MRRKLIFVIIAVILAFSGCKKEVKENYVARVNEEKLTEEEFRSAFNEDKWREMTDSQKETYLDEWIRLTLLAQECDKQGISDQPVIKNRITSSSKKIKANSLIAYELSSIQVSEEELLSFYNLHKNDYRKRNKEYKYQRIFVKDKSLLDDISEELRNGVKFKELAIKHSEEPEGKNGGYMGFVSENNVSSDIWNTLESLNQYNWKSLEYKDGFLIVRWYEKHDAEIEMPFSDIRPEIEKIYRSENQKDRYNELIENLQENSIIEKRLTF